MSDALALIENLADLAHRQWAGWMRYLWRVESPDMHKRWRRQANTKYVDLPPAEQDSDRDEARRVVRVLRCFGVRHGTAALVRAVYADPPPLAGDVDPSARSERLAELALRIVNLRRCLDAANRIIAEIGGMTLRCRELEFPSFAEGRRFWAAVRQVQAEPFLAPPVLPPQAYYQPPAPALEAEAGEGGNDGTKESESESESKDKKSETVRTAKET